MPESSDGVTRVLPHLRARLTEPQARILEELNEENGNAGNEWAVPRKWLRSLYILREHGLAVWIPNCGGPSVWAITERGRDWLRSKSRTT